MVDSSDIKGFIDVGDVFDVNVTLCFTQIDHRDEKVRHSRHFSPPSLVAHKRHQIMKMMYLVVIITKTSHDSFQSSVNYHNSDRGMLCRSKIGDNIDEISHTCHFGLGNAT